MPVTDGDHSLPPPGRTSLLTAAALPLSRPVTSPLGRSPSPPTYSDRCPTPSQPPDTNGIPPRHWQVLSPLSLSLLRSHLPLHPRHPPSCSTSVAPHPHSARHRRRCPACLNPVARLRLDTDEPPSSAASPPRRPVSVAAVICCCSYSGLLDDVTTALAVPLSSGRDPAAEPHLDDARINTTTTSTGSKLLCPSAQARLTATERTPPSACSLSLPQPHPMLAVLLGCTHTVPPSAYALLSTSISPHSLLSQTSLRCPCLISTATSKAAITAPTPLS